MIKLTKSAFYKEKRTRQLLIEFIKEAAIFSMGKECRQFEKAFAEKQGRKFAVFVNSGSSANLILIQSLLNLGKIKHRGLVGVSALTWATNVMPFIQLGLKPVPIDCEVKTLNVSLRTLKKCKYKLKAFFLTNVLGFSGQIDQIQQYCRQKGILFLEDNCEGLGSRVNNQLLGNFGLAATFSFFVGHHLSTIEGGMVVTDDEVLYHMLLKVRAHGWDRDLPLEKQQEIRLAYNVDNFLAYYTFYDLAYNVRPTDIAGSLGNIQINYWDEIVRKREGNFKLLNAAIKTNPELLALDVNHMNLVSNFAMPVIAKTKFLLEKYKKRFKDHQVEIRPIIIGDITKQPFFRKYCFINNNCPTVEFIHQNGFYFPNNPELTKKEVNLLCSLVKKAG